MLGVHLAHVLFMKPDNLQDYVKWRGPLFHRFLLALVDDSSSVRALAEYLLTDTLASKVKLCTLISFLPFSLSTFNVKGKMVLFAMALLSSLCYVSCCTSRCYEVEADVTSAAVTGMAHVTLDMACQPKPSLRTQLSKVPCIPAVIASVKLYACDSAVF